MNVLVYYCLQAYGFYEEGQKIAHRTIEEISRWYLRTGCFYEYYDSQTTTPPPELPRKGAPGKRGGVGFGVVPDLQWTAAAYVHFGHLIA